MPAPKPLTDPWAARATLAHRLTRKADRIRQLYTRFGLRSARVFLVWSQFSGEERGEGTETVLARVELLPTPRVGSLDAISRRPYSAGVFPEGSLRVDQISCGAYTDDMLRGKEIPIDAARGCVGGCRPVSALESQAINAKGPDLQERSTDTRIDFWWEIVEDGRGGEHEQRERYRLLGGPNRNEGALYWSVNLERADEPLDRSGRPQIGVNTADADEETLNLNDEDGPL